MIQRGREHYRKGDLLVAEQTWLEAIKQSATIPATNKSCSRNSTFASHARSMTRSMSRCERASGDRDESGDGRGEPAGSWWRWWHPYRLKAELRAPRSWFCLELSPRPVSLFGAEVLIRRRRRRRKWRRWRRSCPASPG